MLRSQYGVATSSSVTPTASHAEDAQPNEVIYKRRHGRPPQIGSTWKNNYGGSGIQPGGYSGLWTRGNSSRRGRGHFQPNRGGHNSNQRYTGQEHRSTHHSVPPIATLPDVEYRLPSSSNQLSSLIKPSDQPGSPVTVIRNNRLPQAKPRYKVPQDAPTLDEPTVSEHRVDDDYRWLHRSSSPSPKLPQSAFKRRNIEHQPTYVSNSGRNVDSVISQSVKHHSLTAEPTRPKSIDNKPLLPGRHRRFESSSPIHALHSAEPLVQVVTAVSSTVPNILAGTSTIKKEPRTPSPASSRMERSLITSSCKFYPIPEFCKKTFPGFKENRSTFFKEKMQELTSLGLTKVKSFFRYVLPASPRCTYQSLTLIGMMALRSSGMRSRRTSLPILFTFL
jgi:hypothetical protein